MEPKEFSSDWILEQTRKNNEIDWSQDDPQEPEEEIEDWDEGFGEGEL